MLGSGINKVRSKTAQLICALVRPHAPDTDTNSVYLTFDDGPHPEYTRDISSILIDRGHLGTFFLIGQQAEQYPQVVHELKSAGHSIGSHSSVHRKQWETRFKNQMTDYRMGHQQVEGVVNQKVHLFRPPYGHYDHRAALFSLFSNTRTYLWTLESFDWQEGASVKSIADNVVPFIEAGSIVLLHDAIFDNPSARDRSATVAALVNILDAIEAKGLKSKGLPC